MKISELQQKLKSGALSAYADLYADLPAETARMRAALDCFSERYGNDRDVSLFSVPGRSEIIGNHTDHNRGCVIAGAIDRDVIAVASPNEDGHIRFFSEGISACDVDLTALSPDAFPRGSSESLIAGVAAGLRDAGYPIGGFDAYSVTEVARGSGLSSSAAFEVMIGNILNHFCAGGKISPVEIAKIAQYSENVYFGKPCGLMDQVACAVGGFVFIDFADPEDPVIEPLKFSLADAGYCLFITATGGNHADLTDDYASVPAEMKAVAKALGREVLRGATETQILAKAPELRQTVGDRAILRSLHFIRENARVSRAKDALLAGNVDAFLREIRASGLSSFTYLQNVYTVKNVTEQGLSLALAVADGFLAERGAFRVHGGGFAGTVQSFVPISLADAFTEKLDGVFGKGAATRLSVRPAGAIKLF